MQHENIRKILLELDTGGNIRFEEGTLQDKWYHLCVDLINSRYNDELSEACDIHGITITQITRVQNKFLKIKFEDSFAAFQEQPKKIRDCFEYLFFNIDDMS